MPGAVIVVIVMVLVGPIAVMLGGAVLSAVMGWSLVEETEERSREAESADA